MTSWELESGLADCRTRLAAAARVDGVYRERARAISGGGCCDREIYGPVIRDVYVKFSEFGGSPIKMIFPDAVRFENDEQEDFINTIIEKLRGLSPWNLVRVSHAKGSPWDEVYNRRGQDKGIIPNGLIVAAAKADQNG